jgi:fermentation-respiration switch protein FrsA (DUF1100 family)
LAYRVRQDYHLPAFPLLESASLMCYLLTGMRFSDVRPIAAIHDVSIPILFCHGAQDDYIPPQMSMEMVRAKQNGLARLYLAPNARHAESYWNNRVEYERVVGEFLTEAGLI